MTSNPAYVALCARCDRPWAENDPGVRYIPVTEHGYDWFCTDEVECDERRFEAAQAGGHPDGF